MTRGTLRTSARRSASVLVTVACLCACAPLAEPAPRVLEPRLFLPKDRENVYLNEPLVLYFSAELDRSSVTSESVRIRAEDGSRARGSFEVEGEALRFVPDRVYARDLSDGGYRSGTRYTVTLLGFPAPDGLRASDGAPLARGMSWSFRTVDVRETAVGFQDSSPERGSTLTLATRTIGPNDPLLLRCAEPLDPSTLADSDFRLLRARSPQAAPVGVRARLVPDRLATEHAGAGAPGWVELLPLQTLDAGEYVLFVEPTVRLRDYGGNPVWDPSIPADALKVRVTAALQSARGIYRESFLDQARRSPVDPGTVCGIDVDGTAHWSAGGLLSMRFPAAAGSGADGSVRLSRAEPRTDVQATRLELADDLECELSSGPGLVVLRAQKKLRIGGRLARLAREPASMKDTFARGTLSEWLERAAAGGRSWTVLIAGGDLSIDGSVIVDGPLLLVAGGVIRVSGSVQAPPNELWILGEGGGRDLRVERADLQIDPPVRNPLAQPLRLAVLSQSIPPRGKVLRWLGGDAKGRSGSGRFRVAYLRDPEDPAAPKPAPLVDTPRLLDESPSIRFFVELEMPPGGEWDPPFVDEVVVTWEEATGREQER